jgi:hypothetical protein
MPLALAVAAAGAGGHAIAGLAARSSPGIVQARPVADTPHFPAHTRAVEQVRQLAQCGGLMYAVGSFSVIEQGGRTYTRHNAFSFDASAPFTLTSWAPVINGKVNSITFNSGHCSDAYVGGEFTRIDGTKVEDIAEVRTSGAGSVVRRFGHFADAAVETLASYQDHVLAGGYFTSINGSSADPYLASLNPTTGRDDRLVALHISGSIEFPGVARNATKVFNQQISHTGKLDLVEGDFAWVGGKRRQQIFMLDLASRPRATVTAWTSPRFDGSAGYPPHGFYYNCMTREPFFIRSAAWSPDDRTVYLATTGFRPWNRLTGFPLRGLCDAAAAFTARPSSRADLKWVNYTGCDSLYSVAADGDTAYFAGHERWSQNPRGCNAPGPGAMPDPGLEGLNAVTGRVLRNAAGRAMYSRGRGLGADDMLITTEGLWIASDNFDGTQACGSVQNLSGICLLPVGP